MKKVFWAALAAGALALVIGGCQKKEAVGGSAASKAGGGKITFICQNQGDMSFNDSGVVGLRNLEKDQGYKTQIVETGDDSSRFDAYIREVCEDPETSYILASGTYTEWMESNAASFPDKKFVIFDVDRNTKPAQPNILYIAYAQNEGSYLVGLISAAISKTGVISTVGGVENPVICDFIVGFIEGAQSYNPNIKVATGWVGSWVDTAKMREQCAMHNSSFGADVFFPVAGVAGTGAFETALDVNTKTPGAVWCIGVDSDQYEVFKASGDTRFADIIYTSMLKDVGASFVSVFTDLKSGKEYWGQLRILGVKENSVGYADNAYFRSLATPELIAKLEEAKQQITDGAFKVKSYADFAGGMSDYNALVNSVKP